MESLEDLPLLEDPRAIGEIVKDLNLSIDDTLDFLENEEPDESGASSVQDQAVTQTSEMASVTQSSQAQVADNVQRDDINH